MAFRKRTAAIWRTSEEVLPLYFVSCAVENANNAGARSLPESTHCFADGAEAAFIRMGPAMHIANPIRARCWNLLPRIWPAPEITGESVSVTDREHSAEGIGVVQDKPTKDWIHQCMMFLDIINKRILPTGEITQSNEKRTAVVHMDVRSLGVETTPLSMSFHRIAH